MGGDWSALHRVTDLHSWLSAFIILFFCSEYEAAGVSELAHGGSGMLLRLLTGVCWLTRALTPALSQRERESVVVGSCATP